jgi:polygalacturonase
MRSGVESVTIDSLTFDGNKDNNQVYLGWTFNVALTGRTGLKVTNSKFINTPGNAITAFGTDVLISDNTFSNLDGPIVHLSGNTPVGNTFVTIQNNTISDTNFQATRMGHSEGVITISKANNSIRVLH